MPIDTAFSLEVRAPAFSHGGEIPARHTCEGQDLSPALRWRGAPSTARSLVLIVDDPDAPDPAAPRRVWVHWLLYNLPVDSTGVEEGVRPEELPTGTLEGTTDFRRTGWGGPCPPVGRHRYFFRLYALDTVLPDLHAPARGALEAAMAGHIVGRGELMGTYQKRGREG